jgi:tetratricopeptide (TPR) repeat protein
VAGFQNRVRVRLERRRELVLLTNHVRVAPRRNEETPCAVCVENHSNQFHNFKGGTMKRHKRKPSTRSNGQALSAAHASTEPDRRYDYASALSDEGNYAEARRLYFTIDNDEVAPSLRAEAINSLAVLDALDERFDLARARFRRALAIDPTCENARRNIAGLESCGCGCEE